MLLGTCTARQGQGLGSKLLACGTDQADGVGLPCYLETATDENVTFYRKRGFEVTGETTFQGYVLRAMVRKPR